MKIIWVVADYRHEHSPWLVQFDRIHNRAGEAKKKMVENPYEQTECKWEDFASPIEGEVIIPKPSWSCNHTPLTKILRETGIKSVLVCGLITSVCVQHSAFGIFEAGYQTFLVTDACADRGRGRHDAALALYGNYMYHLVTSKELEDLEKYMGEGEVGVSPADKKEVTLTFKKKEEGEL